MPRIDIIIQLSLISWYIFIVTESDYFAVLKVPSNGTYFVVSIISQLNMKWGDKLKDVTCTLPCLCIHTRDSNPL